MDENGECIIEQEAQPNIQTASCSTIAVSQGSQNGTDGAQPRFITVDHLNFCSALAPSAQSHTIFGNIAWIWPNHERSPFFGIGGKVEFSTQNSTLSQWGFWFKGGMNI